MAGGDSEGFSLISLDKPQTLLHGLNQAMNTQGTPMETSGIFFSYQGAELWGMLCRKEGDRSQQGVPDYGTVSAEWVGCPQARSTPGNLPFYSLGKAGSASRILPAHGIPAQEHWKTIGVRGQGDGSALAAARSLPLVGFLGDSSLICGSCFSREMLLIQAPKSWEGSPQASDFSA